MLSFSSFVLNKHTKPVMGFVSGPWPGARVSVTVRARFRPRVKKLSDANLKPKYFLSPRSVQSRLNWIIGEFVRQKESNA